MSSNSILFYPIIACLYVTLKQFRNEEREKWQDGLAFSQRTHWKNILYIFYVKFHDIKTLQKLFMHECLAS